MAEPRRIGDRFGLFIPLLGTLAFIAIWELACTLFRIRTILLPSPSLILTELLTSPLWFAEQTMYTVLITLAAFLAAGVFGVLFAILIVEWPLLDRLLFRCSSASTACQR